MNSEVPLGRPKEIRQRTEPNYVLYFAGVKDDRRKLSGVQTALERRFPGRVEILPSIISRDFPAPRKLNLANNLIERLNRNEEIELICHSLGTVELARVFKQIIQIKKDDPDLLTNHVKQLHLTLISPAGLYPNLLGFPEFLTRVINNYLSRGRSLLPDILRAYTNDSDTDKLKPSMANLEEDVRTIWRLMMGEAYQQLQRAEQIGVDVRFVHLGIDPIVTQSDILRYFGNKFTWQQLIDLDKVISIDGWSHATHTLQPEELIKRLYPQE